MGKGPCQIQLLDCTFRDGGQGLQASYLYGLQSAGFTEDIIRRGISHLSGAGCDIIEVGYIDDKLEKMAVYASYSDLDMLSSSISNESSEMKNQMYVGLFTGPDAPLSGIPEKGKNKIEGVRVILRYSELDRSLDFCRALSEKGYKVFIQPMLTMRYSDEDLKKCIQTANDIKAYALYFVDSFGYMQEGDIERLFAFYHSRLDETIKIGFHAHNNLGLAFSNVKRFIDLAVKSGHDCIVDSTCVGMGQGAGNFQSEIAVHYLNKQYGKNYDLNHILEVCEMIESLTEIGQWGYSVMYALPAMYDAAYKYALIMRQKLGMSYVQMNNVFANMEGDIKHRYTKDNLLMMLDKLNIDIDVRRL